VYRGLIGLKDADGRTMRHWVTRDPRDITSLNFRHPKTGRLCRVPAWDSRMKPTTIWDNRARRRALLEQAERDYEFDAVMEGTLEGRKMRADAKQRTAEVRAAGRRAAVKVARRAAERRRIAREGAQAKAAGPASLDDAAALRTEASGGAPPAPRIDRAALKPPARPTGDRFKGVRAPR
jgi:hypothetical protein